MNTENTAEEKTIHAVITNDRGDVFIDGGYEAFCDAIDVMLNKWDNLTSQERVSIKKRNYCDENGADYMVAVGFYNEETGEACESMSLAEAIEIIGEEEEEDE